MDAPQTPFLGTWLLTSLQTNGFSLLAYSNSLSSLVIPSYHLRGRKYYATVTLMYIISQGEHIENHQIHYEASMNL